MVSLRTLPSLQSRALFSRHDHFQRTIGAPDFELQGLPCLNLAHSLGIALAFDSGERHTIASHDLVSYHQTGLFSGEAAAQFTHDIKPGPWFFQQFPVDSNTPRSE